MSFGVTVSTLNVLFQQSTLELGQLLALFPPRINL